MSNNLVHTQNLELPQHKKLTSVKLPSFQELMENVINYCGHRSLETFEQVESEDIRRQLHHSYMSLEQCQILQLDMNSFGYDLTSKLCNNQDNLELIQTLTELDKLVKTFNHFVPVVEDIKKIIDSNEDLNIIRKQVEDKLNAYNISSIESLRLNSAKIREQFGRLLQLKQASVAGEKQLASGSQTLKTHPELSRNTTISPKMDRFSKRDNSLSSASSSGSLRFSSSSPPPSTSVASKAVSIQGKIIKAPTGAVSECQQCTTSDTPEWRKGPTGPKTLCNACGLFYGKLVKKFGTFDANSIMEHRRPNGLNIDRRVPQTLSEIK